MKLEKPNLRLAAVHYEPDVLLRQGSRAVVVKVGAPDNI